MSGNNPFLQYGPSPLRAPAKAKNDAPYRGPVRSDYKGPAVTGKPLPAYSDLSQTGAPLKVRAALASTPRAADKLKTLQNYYPGARPYGSDNFIFQDPKSKKWTIFNPRGLDSGDVVEQGRLVANIGAGALAAAPSVVTGPGAIVAAGAGATAGGVLYDKVVQAATGAKDTRTAGEQATDAGIETGLNVVIPYAGGKVLKGARNLFRTGEGDVVDAFTRLGGQAPVTAAGGKATRMTGGVLESQIPSSGIMTARNEAAIKTIKTGVDKTAADFGAPATKDEAGKIILDAADSYVQGFRATAKTNYDAVDALIPPKTRVGFDEFATKVDDINGRFSADPEWEKLLVDPEMRQIIEAVDSSVAKGGIDYGTMKAIRSQLGQEINRGQGKLIGVLGMDDTKMLYGALTRDLETAARTVAGDTGAAAAQTANNFWKEGRRVIDGFVTPIVKNGANTRAPEAALDKFLATAQNTPSALTAWENVIPSAGRAKLGAFTLRDMGTPRAGQFGDVATDANGVLFSPTNYTKVFDNLFNGPNQQAAKGFFFPDQALSQTADDAYRAATAMKGAATETNNSRTGVITGATNLGTSALGIGLGLLTGDAATATAAGVAAPLAFSALTNPVARAVTNPTVERILTRPALDSALPEVTSRLPQWAVSAGRTLIGETTQPRNELNADTGEQDQNPFFAFGQY